MGCKCGSQAILCNLPIRFDTYTGCSHACRYCFAQKKVDISQIKTDEGVQALKSHIEGNRNIETSWCDWNIPIHWGGMSDPFQPIEAEMRASYECLRLFADTQYPFVVSTKGRLAASPEYIDLLSACNCVVQISMVCPAYDKLETGCPPYMERLDMVSKLSARVQRVVIRIQPYMHEVFREVIGSIPKLAGAGVYGIILEGMKFAKGKPGMTRVDGDSCYPLELLRNDFTQIRSAVHANGMKFYCGENRLRTLGDDMTCCGIDGLEGFKPNEYNLCMIVNGKQPKPTERMMTVGTAGCFKALKQDAGSSEKLRHQSLAGFMQSELLRDMDYYKLLFGARS